MTAVLDFAMLPPEINSGRMYSGPGSGPMLAAASAWNGVAAELRSAALSYGSVLSALTSEEWHGPASAAMAAAVMPYVAWMSTTAAQAEQTAAQADAAAAAYEVAFAATVPPPVIAANRTQLAALIATNILGQNTPAIAVTEAQYVEMWAQDAAAMYTYAGSSAAATRLSQFTEPQQTTNANGLAGQAAAVTRAAGTSAGNQQATLSQVLSTLPATLQGMASPASPSSLEGTSGLLGMLLTGSSGNSVLDNFWSQWGPNAAIWNTIFSSGFYMPSNTMAPFLGLLGAQAAGNAVGGAAAQGAPAAFGEALAGPIRGVGGLGSSVSAGLGNASAIGPLSVPPSWTAPAPLASPLASTLGGTPMVAPPPALATGVPAMPMGGVPGQGYGRAVPQYGFRPNFVVRPPAAG